MSAAGTGLAIELKGTQIWIFKKKKFHKHLGSIFLLKILFLVLKRA